MPGAKDALQRLGESSRAESTIMEAILRSTAPNDPQIQYPGPGGPPKYRI